MRKTTATKTAKTVKVAATAGITFTAPALPGHKKDCLCPECLISSMEEHCGAKGWSIPWKRENSQPQGADLDGKDVNTSQRTRYAKPGAQSGNGTVRRASAAQINFLKKLIAERDTTNLIRLPGSEDVENISKRGATDLIDKLLECPMRRNINPSLTQNRPTSATAATPAAGPTDKQTTFAHGLIDRKFQPEDRAAVREAFAKLTTKEASRVIDVYLGQPDVARPVTPATPGTTPSGEITQGMYRTPEGVIFKVVPSRTSGRLYASRLDGGTGKFEYEAGAIRRLRAEWRMTLEQAQEYGRLTGQCCKCGAMLTNPESIERGIGPICAGGF